MFSGPITKPGIFHIRRVPRRHSSPAMWRHNSPFSLHSVQARNAGKKMFLIRNRAWWNGKYVSRARQKCRETNS